MTAPIALFGDALRRAADGERDHLDLVDPGGRTIGRLHPADWSAGLRPGDRALLDRCVGSTLDIGCGPGRLAAALTRHGRTVLGVDICPEAVRQARRRGAVAWLGNVFATLPMEGGWNSILLADGNIGIGGDPHRLLSRCAALLRNGGTILTELHPPGEPTWSGSVRLSTGDTMSTSFPWATVAAHDAAGLAHGAGLGVRALWTEAGRWFAQLVV